MGDRLAAAIVAGQGAGAVVLAGGDVLQHTVVGLDIRRVKINQVRHVGRVGIMAGGANRAITFKMRLV